MTAYRTPGVDATVVVKVPVTVIVVVVAQVTVDVTGATTVCVSVTGNVNVCVSVAGDVQVTVIVVGLVNVCVSVADVTRVTVRVLTSVSVRVPLVVRVTLPVAVLLVVVRRGHGRFGPTTKSPCSVGSHALALTEIWTQGLDALPVRWQSVTLDAGLAMTVVGMRTSSINAAATRN